MKKEILGPVGPLLAGSLFALASSAAMAVPVRTASSPAEALSLLTTSSAGALKTSLRRTDAYVAVHALPGAALLADGAALPPLARAQNFLAGYGALSGVSDPLQQLQSRRIVTDRTGITHVHLDQVQNGLPVFGARLVVHMSPQGIVGVNGVFVPGLESLSMRPAMGIADLRGRGLAVARKLYPDATDLHIESTRLMYYRSGLLKGVATQSNHLAYEVMVKGGRNDQIRERVILDANSGAVLNHINEIHSVLHRKIYTPEYQNVLIVEEGDATAPADPPLVQDDRTATSSRVPDIPYNNLYIFAGGTWQMYKNLFGRDGYNDGAEGITDENQVQESVYAVDGSCPNASWNGTFTYYCPGFDADDVVSHEWSHAYTEYTHGLVYQYQSGALNEGYSDIFGETYDLVNGIEGPLGATLTEGEYYADRGSRWVVGEDLSEAVANVLLRDMWSPDDFAIRVDDPVTGTTIINRKSPGSVITSPNYYCATGDNGGVHFNSGVPNHAYAMLVDGKEYNGVTIPGIGITKAAHIYFQAETHYQTPTTNFAQHADALEQSCQDLIGAPLNDVLGAVSDEVIGASDCEAVAKTVLATEMRGKDGVTAADKCGYVPVLQPEATTPALCATGKFVTPSYSQTWEGGTIPSDWTISKNMSGDFESPTFEYLISSELPAPHTGKALFARNDGDGTCATGGDASGSLRADSPEFTVPDDASFLSFTHFMQSEAGYDGANLKYSLNGADFALVPQNAFTYNAHSGEFEPAPLPGDAAGVTGTNTNPMADEGLAWTGSDQGEATGSWGTTVVDIATLGAAKGAKIKFRWEFGQDGCGGNLGWFIDDTQVFYCGLTDPGTGSSSGGSSSGASSSGASSSGASSSGGSSSGGSSGGGDGRFGGAFGWLLLVPMFGVAALRRRRQD